MQPQPLCQLQQSSTMIMMSLYVYGGIQQPDPADSHPRAPGLRHFAYSPRSALMRELAWGLYEKCLTCKVLHASAVQAHHDRRPALLQLTEGLGLHGPPELEHLLDHPPPPNCKGSRVFLGSQAAETAADVHRAL